jgi:threonine dehydrogenase-like Zn-dependent dehydrogenase
MSDATRQGMPHIAVIGAGLRGLASSAWLISEGASVKIFEKSDQLGGVWRLVHKDARINTPSYGYTFHEGNRWVSKKPTQVEIVENLNRLVRDCGLESSISYSNEVRAVQKNSSGRWTIHDGEEAFDGILVCPGFLGAQKKPPREMAQAFEGMICCAYDVEPHQLEGQNVVVVGSGSSALDMLALAVGSGCAAATLSIREGVMINDISRAEVIKHSIASNPFLYRLTKMPGGKPAAVRQGIRQVLENPITSIERTEITSASGHSVQFGDSREVPADVIIWCTGWESALPQWATIHRGDPRLVIASCAHCLDTAGFGFGTATVHAKALMASINYGLKNQFRSGTSNCRCDQPEYAFARHIIVNLMLFYLSQPGGWKILAREFGRGFTSNLRRFRSTDENKLASLLAFFNAPFGL